MFGRMRPPSASLDSLGRPPPKILKHDSLSIYEATLMKLKQGSQRDPSSSSVPVVEKESNDAPASVPEFCWDANPSTPCMEAEKIEHNYNSASSSPISSDSQSSRVSKLPQSRTISVLYLFSKYNSSKHVLSPSHEEAMMIENDGSSLSI
ncbi:hypothetical protein CFOL_v3_11521 [Cephalotus follicularis]|uniref:Uncharacterized protein n=1 Tax=Cephalotus follicularis TaxID=3775 RepID=A0A1Q3BJA7_CEPFO|nr:hypothetical protein CFOL_v3_11521 [Cephalotus follicularis]